MYPLLPLLVKCIFGILFRSLYPLHYDLSSPPRLLLCDLYPLAKGDPDLCLCRPSCPFTLPLLLSLFAASLALFLVARLSGRDLTAPPFFHSPLVLPALYEPFPSNDPSRFFFTRLNTFIIKSPLLRLVSSRLLSTLPPGISLAPIPAFQLSSVVL